MRNLSSLIGCRVSFSKPFVMEDTRVGGSTRAREPLEGPNFKYSRFNLNLHLIEAIPSPRIGCRRFDGRALSRTCEFRPRVQRRWRRCRVVQTRGIRNLLLESLRRESYIVIFYGEMRRRIEIPVLNYFPHRKYYYIILLHTRHFSII